MSKNHGPSKILSLVESTRALRDPIRRAARLAKLATQVEPGQAEAVFVAALEEIARIRDPWLRDAARGFVVDAHVGLGQYAQALALASRMESAYQRALCYAEVRHAVRSDVDKTLANSADAGFVLAREQLDSDSRADLERAVRLIEED
ncbi:hypothetical protein EPO34_01245 [Patescibacteria group bacterium]|nr:MAG: hypothetical protein EPO34_01245 [Patescibacteria group bacterium]